MREGFSQAISAYQKAIGRYAGLLASLGRRPEAIAEGKRAIERSQGR
jgi:hypothetical protein